MYESIKSREVIDIVLVGITLTFFFVLEHRIISAHIPLKKHLANRHDVHT
jgi:hypothetical protein